LYTIRSTGELSLNFGWLNDTPQAMINRDKLKELIEKKKLLKIPAEYETHFPHYKIEIWYKKVDDLLEIINELIK